MGIQDSNTTNSRDESVCVIAGETSGLRADVDVKSSGKKGLHVIAEAQAGSSPTISTKLRTTYTDVDITLTSSFQDIFSFNGTGKFYGFGTEFTTKDVEVKLIIDSQTIFTLTMPNIKDICSVESNTNFLSFFKIRADDTFQFSPSDPIVFSTNFTVQAKLTSGGPKMDWIATIYEDLT